MIQEANLVDNLKSLLDSEHPYWTLNDAFHYRDRATGVLTASRVRPVYTCGQRTAEPFIRLPKTSLLSYYPVEGMNENLLIANIHGINFTLGVGVYREQIEKLYDVMKYHQGPIVLAGDFNTWSDARMEVVDDLAQRLSLKSLDYTSHNRTIVFGNAIDHVYFRGLVPLEHDTWYVTSSDHNPTRVSFRVKDNAVAVDKTDLAVEELDDENC
jgi:endonuclease/exonuclease/phosphatase (EEP) superfamily protein YafD